MIKRTYEGVSETGRIVFHHTAEVHDKVGLGRQTHENTLRHLKEEFPDLVLWLWKDE